MSAIFGLAIVIFGALTAYLSGRRPGEAQGVETAAGMLVIAGFALIGSALPVMV